MTAPRLADLHTHVLPAVDDGAPDLASAVATLEALAADGVTAVCATPHLRASDGATGERRRRADEAWAELAAALSARARAVELARGFEILLDAPLDGLRDPGLRLNGSRYVLVEWVGFQIPDDSADRLRAIAEAGYVPVVAHAERYFGYRGRYDVVAAWRKAGALVQVNSGSLLGEHGEGPQRQAEALFAQGGVDLLASDTHARPGRSPSVRAAYDHLRARGAGEHAELLCAVNPRRILEDAPTLPVPPLAAGRRRGLRWAWDRIRWRREAS
jgi:protein-tyrosine phosphatase